jgi:glycosyltransferase involved in cell wall biosynthesis
MHKKNSLLLFTHAFPYGNGEQWMESEILYLAQNFERIYISPNIVEGISRPLPDNCSVVLERIKFDPEKKLRYYVLKNWFKVLKYFIYLVLVSENRIYYLKNILSVLAHLSVIQEEAALYYTSFEKYLNETRVLFFYWFINPFICFAMLKAGRKIDHKLVSRAHGYDYDVAQNPLGFFLFRELELKYIDDLVVNNRWGAGLVKNLYPGFSSKVSSSYVGLKDGKKLNPDNTSELFHLVSCSYLIELKRVNLIIEILKHVNIRIKWTHLGDGPLMDELKQQAMKLPSNILCDFYGYIPSALDYYRSMPCDLFITTTRREGLPFSLIESISHGIPVMGTAVCGIPEIVNKQTGFIIPLDFDPADISRIITDYSLRSADEKAALRKSARTFYEKTFDADIVFNSFIKKYLL